MATNPDVIELESAYQTALASAGSAEGAATESILEDFRGVKERFRELWPDVKQGLELLRTLSGLVPGVGAVVTSVISIVITAGDAAFKAVS